MCPETVWGLVPSSAEGLTQQRDAEKFKVVSACGGGDQLWVFDGCPDVFVGVSR